MLVGCRAEPSPAPTPQVKAVATPTPQVKAVATPTPQTEAASAFYKGKVVEFVVPYAPGGGYDTWARLLAPFLSKHLGAQVIVKNEPAAGGKAALNRLQKESNGLSLTMFAPRAAATAQIYQQEGVAFDLTQFNWIGRASRDLYPICVGARSGYKSIADLQQAKKEVKFASDTPTSGKAIRPTVMANLLGIKVRLVAGYKGSADEILAVQRGEVDGTSTTFLTLRSYIQSGDLIPVLVMEHERIKGIPAVPTIYEAKQLTDREKHIADIAIAFDAVGRPLATTPGVPKERVAFLEAALKKALEEPELRQKVEALGETIDYGSGKETAELINTLLKMSEEDKVLFGKLLGIEGY
jgi:tripartite-type tricarboxylate transporter receptor subunit TctC